jgi:hypothetical protein
MVDVTDGADVDVGLGALELLLGHPRVLCCVLLLVALFVVMVAD